MKTTVIYHSSDFDGIFCREIARKFLPDAELIGWDFKDEPIDFCALGISPRLIYVMDLPVDRVFGWERIEAIRDVIWIDHHKSSIETHPKDIPGYRIDGVAACRLVWQWFTHEIANKVMSDASYLPAKEDFFERRVSEPLSVRLAGEYDIFDKRDPNAELFQHGLRSCDLDGKWASLFDSGHEGDKAVRHLLENGRVLQFARANEYLGVITQQGFDVVWEGRKFLACNSHELDIRSHLFEAGIKPHHEALLGFTTNGKDWRVSMYHIPGKEHVDILSLAKANGGGGHVGACGCRVKTLPFLT